MKKKLILSLFCLGIISVIFTFIVVQEHYKEEDSKTTNSVPTESVANTKTNATDTNEEIAKDTDNTKSSTTSNSNSTDIAEKDDIESKATVAEGSTDAVLGQLNEVESSAIDDYNGMTLLGVNVKAAYSNFVGKPFAIIVATKTMIDSNQDTDKIPGLKEFSTNNGLDGLPVPITVDGVTTTNSDGKKVSVWGVNYNAVLNNTTLTVNGDYYVTDDTFASNKESVVYYDDVNNMIGMGTGEFIATGANFQSTLIKDSTGSIVGIFFLQVSDN